MKKSFFIIMLVAILPMTVMATDYENMPFVGYFVRNWNAIDSSYVEPNLYYFKVKLIEQNDQEQMNIKSDDGTEIQVRSPFVPSAGVGLYYSGFGTNLTFNLTKSKIFDGSKRTTFTVRGYCQMFNFNFQYRKSGSDYKMRKLILPGLGDIINPEDELAESMKTIEGLGDGTELGNHCDVKMYSLDVNYVWNHKKFAYSAAQTFSRRQLRSSGSIVTGLALAHYKINNDFANFQSESAILQVYAAGYNKSIYEVLNDIMDNRDDQEFFGRKLCSTMNFTDIDLNLGYAYNWVPARNLLVQGSFTITPAVKICSGNNHNSSIMQIFSNTRDQTEMGKEIIENIDYEYNQTDDQDVRTTLNKFKNRMLSGEAYDNMEYSYKQTILDFNYNLKIAAAWSNSRWFAGAQFQLQHNRYHSNLYTKFDNIYGTLTFNVGVYLVRKGKFREGGKYADRYQDPAIFNNKIFKKEN